MAGVNYKNKKPAEVRNQSVAQVRDKLTKLTTRDGIRIVERTGSDGKPRLESFHIVLYEKLKDATLVQVRVISEESRELILDRLFAARPQAPATRQVSRPPVLRRPDIMKSERKPFRHAPLSERTVEDKARLDQDGRKLIAEGDYTYGIEVVKGEKAGEKYYTVRPKPAVHPRANVTHRVLAAWLEFGTKKMPKRPHWGPTLRVVKQVLKQQGPKVRAQALREALRERR